MTSDPAIVVEELRMSFATRAGPVEVLDGVSLSVGSGEIVGLVGESGSGKSITAMTLMRLLPPSVWAANGKVSVLGQDMLALDGSALEDFRGARISMIFQEPATALNPVLRVGSQIAEVIRRHSKASRREAEVKARQLLGDMQIRDIDRVMRAYPFMLSGGMRQRVLIAMAFACGPGVLVADEPTTALDVTVQAQVLRLLRDMARRSGTAVLLITHDMGVVRHLCDRIYVIHAGQIVEHGSTLDVIAAPAHPYTRALLSALPECFAPKTPIPALDLTAISPIGFPPGCRFAPRCRHVGLECEKTPPFIVHTEGHFVACWKRETDSR
ncbi:ABC transporter ATP-binding protein [Sphingosinicella sp.]|uniref:ABC transporter ATP-binding protein n=1 Tax=Sphingosinicella sp. TaxID=1917971 RepID=UPI0035B34F45